MIDFAAFVAVVSGLLILAVGVLRWACRLRPRTRWMTLDAGDVADLEAAREALASGRPNEARRLLDALVRRAGR